MHPNGGERWVSRTVIGIVLATFFSDVGHEMVTAVLPLYLASVGFGPAAPSVTASSASDRGRRRDIS